MRAGGMHQSCFDKEGTNTPAIPARGLKDSDGVRCYFSKLSWRCFCRSMGYLCCEDEEKVRELLEGTKAATREGKNTAIHLQFEQEGESTVMK